MRSDLQYSISIAIKSDALVSCKLEVGEKLEGEKLEVGEKLEGKKLEEGEEQSNRNRMQAREGGRSTDRSSSWKKNTKKSKF